MDLDLEKLLWIQNQKSKLISNQEYKNKKLKLKRMKRKRRMFNNKMKVIMKKFTVNQINMIKNNYLNFLNKNKEKEKLKILKIM